MKRDAFAPGAVSRETKQRLDTYAELLVRWNRRINLVSRHTLPDLWQRHFADSLQLAALIPASAANAADLGSGAGFPGLVLAIATGLPFTLIEADMRKAAFLREVAEATQAPVSVHAGRLEAAALPLFDLVTARALAALPDLLPQAVRFLAPGGALLLLKGARADEELTDAFAEWQMKVDRHDSVTDPRGVILRLTEVHRV